MKIWVIKQNLLGEEIWRYSGKVIERGVNHLVLEAYFDREDIEFHGIWLCKGDRFIETYFYDCWYNIFEIHDRVSDELKGWYCNICEPAVYENEILWYRDLALDLMVFPNGRQIVLDMDEFKALSLPLRKHNKALEAMKELQREFKLKLGAAK